MSGQTVVGKRYTIVVPKSVREQVSLKEGQDVLVTAEGKKIIIEPLPDNPYEILGRVIRRPYDEKRDEHGAERWMKRRAGH